MPALKIALDETRMLILGDQILLGFEMRAVFEPGFAQYPYSQKLVALAAIALQALVLGALLHPLARHHLTDHQESTPGLLRATRTTAASVMLCFAAALGLDFELAAHRVSPGLAPWVGAAVALVALLAWFGVGWPLRRTTPQEEKMKQPDLSELINDALTEARVALPGAQALLGFQLVTVLLQSFAKLPSHAKALHLASTLLIGLSTVLLVMPAAFHRLAERGAMTPRFLRVVSTCVMISLAPMALGIAGEVAVVFYAVLESTLAATIAGVASGLIILGLWYIVPWALRARSEHPSGVLREA